MQYSTALSDALLALACLGAAVWLGKARSRFAETNQPALFCALLGLLLPAAAALSGAVRYGLTAEWREAHVLLARGLPSTPDRESRLRDAIRRELEEEDL